MYDYICIENYNLEVIETPIIQSEEMLSTIIYHKSKDRKKRYQTENGDSLHFRIKKKCKKYKKYNGTM